MITGDVLKIEGEFYTVHDETGHEVRLHIDKTTKLESAFKTGDKVEVQVTDKGPATECGRTYRPAHTGALYSTSPRPSFLSRSACKN